MQPALDEALSAPFASPQATPLAGAPQLSGAATRGTDAAQEEQLLDAAQKAMDARKVLIHEKPEDAPVSKVRTTSATVVK